jgi:DNA polymerase-3 subunit delta
VFYSGVEQFSSKTSAAPLVSYLKNPAADVTLVMISEEVSAEKSLKDAVGPAGTKVFWEMFDDKKEEWVRSFFRREGFQVDEGAVQALLDLVENNTDALRAECQRLTQFAQKGTRIDEGLIEEFLSHNRSENAFTLFDRIAAGTLEEAVETLEKILYSKEGEPIGILAGLQWSFKRLLGLEQEIEAGTRLDEALLRSGVRAKKAQSIYKEAARRYPLPVCQAIISRVVETDLALRAGGSEFEKVRMQLFLYSVMKKKGAALAPYESAY